MIRTLSLPLLALAAFPLLGQTIPATINYQGRLTDNTPSQSPINTTVQMQFAIYDAASGGTRLWQEPAANNTGTSIVVSSGIFNYVLGNAVAIPPTVFTGATSVRYLQITLNPAASPEILTPRQLVTSTGYANLAENANSAADSARLGGVLASGWQRALSAQSCTSGRFYSSILQNGTVTCSVPTVVETDPEVGTLSDTNIPVWDASQNMLIDSTLLSSPAGNLTVPGTLAAGSLSGPGSGLTSLDAGNVSSGTLADSRLSSNVDLLNGAQTFTGTHTFGDNLLLLRNPANTFSTTLRAPSATAARVITLPDVTGTAITTGNLSSITTTGTVSSGTWNGTVVATTYGGSGANLSATGGAGQLVKQASAGGAFTVGALTAAELPTGGAWTLTSNLNLDSNTLVVDQLNNRVGVNTAAPDSPLVVSSATAAPVRIGGDSGCGPAFAGIGLYGLMAGCSNYTMIGDTSATKHLYINRPTGANIYFRHNNADQMTISNAGTVAIPSPGILSIGVRIITCTVTTPIQDCACAAGETVISGGGYSLGAGNSLRESRPFSTTTWRLSCQNSTGTDINCSGMNIICARLAP
jgi:hypothetical protein